MTSLVKELERADRLMRERDFSGAASLYATVVNVAPEPYPAWERLLAALAGLNMFDKAFAVVDERQRRFGDGLVLYYWALSCMVREGFQHLAEALIAHTKDNSLLSAVAHYYAGTFELHRGGSRDAAAHLVAAAAVAEKFMDQFKADELMAIAYEGTVFREFESLGNLAAMPRADVFAQSDGIEREARFHRVPSAVDVPFVVYSAMNEAYLDRFGRDAVAAVDTCLRDREYSVYHLHIVDPSREIDTKIAALQAEARHLRLGLSTETFGAELRGYARATYYACSRFVRWPEIAAHYGKPLCTIDVDIAELAHLDAVMTSFAGASFGCFERRDRPALICHASVVATGVTAPSMAFVDLTAKFLGAGLSKKYAGWTLDQITLLVVSRFLMATNPDFRSLDLAKCSGLSLNACFRSAGEVPEKQGMRAAA